MAEELPKETRVTIDYPEKKEPCWKKAGQIVHPVILVVVVACCLLNAAKTWSTSVQVGKVECSVTAHRDEIELLQELFVENPDFVWDESPGDATSQFSRLVRSYERSDCARERGCSKYSKGLGYYYASHDHLQSLYDNDTTSFTKLSDSEKEWVFFTDAQKMDCGHDVYRNQYGQIWCNNGGDVDDMFLPSNGMDTNSDGFKFHYWKSADFMPTTREQYPGFPYILEGQHTGTELASWVRIVEEGIYLLFASVQFRDSALNSGMGLWKNGYDDHEVKIGDCKVYSPNGEGHGLEPCNIFQVVYLHPDDKISMAISAFTKFSVDKTTVYMGFIKLKIHDFATF